MAYHRRRSPVVGPFLRITGLVALAILVLALGLTSTMLAVHWATNLPTSTQPDGEHY